MRRRLALSLVLLLVGTVAFVLGRGGTGLANPEHRDILINHTVTEAKSGRFAGDRLYLFGSGYFSTVKNEVRAAGYFQHVKADGTRVAQGYWKATGIESWVSWGTDPEVAGGFVEGGRLVLDVVFFPDGEPAAKFGNFKITCAVGEEKPGFAVEGVTVGPFGHKEEPPHSFTAFLPV